MTTPDVPHRMELRFEVPGTPEQVWDAIATARGISAWFLPTDLEERLGGAICTHMGETDSPGTVTGWDPPRRFAYEEPEWTTLTGHEGAPVTPLATEFLVEAQSGGTCVVRVVTSAFGTGAEWEQEWFESMERGWVPFFDRLRLYLLHFPGQAAAPLAIETTVPGPAASVLTAMRRDLGVAEVGQTVEAHGLRGTVERLGDDDVLLGLTDPAPGFLGLAAFDSDDGSTMAFVNGQFFGQGAEDVVERVQPIWKQWLEGLDLKSPSTIRN